MCVQRVRSSSTKMCIVDGTDRTVDDTTQRQRNTEEVMRNDARVVWTMDTMNIDVIRRHYHTNDNNKNTKTIKHQPIRIEQQQISE